MSIPAIGPVGFTPMVAPTLPASALSGVDAASQAGAATGASRAEFGNLLSQGLENLQGLHQRADSLAVKAATGDLNAIHDYTITATEASVATQLTTAVRNKALEAFQEIMRMSV
jgi:flagellar hook-basal body complex protein FliE